MKMLRCVFLGAGRRRRGCRRVSGRSRDVVVEKTLKIAHRADANQPSEQRGNQQRQANRGEGNEDECDHGTAQRQQAEAAQKGGTNRDEARRSDGGEIAQHPVGYAVG